MTWSLGVVSNSWVAERWVVDAGANYTHGTIIQGTHNRYTRRTVAHKNERVYVQVLLGIITQPLNNSLGRPMNPGHPLNEALQPYAAVTDYFPPESL